MIIHDIVDGVSRSIEGAADTVSNVFEPTIRLGVTGLSRAGKTVFITSLIANLMDRGRMPQLRAAANGNIKSAYLRPQPDDTIARFDFEAHLDDMIGPEPKWPASTRTISELRLSMKVQPGGLIGAFSGPRTVHLDIVDYPGEWLLDLGLLEKSYAEWSKDSLGRAEQRPQAQSYLQQVSETNASDKLAEVTAQSLAAAYTTYLHEIREAGFSDATPGRFLLPGDLDGSPVLTFAPLPHPDSVPRNSLYREFERRFEAYKSKVVKPFFRDHFSRIDRQVVLIDALSAIHAGPKALDALRMSMVDILQAFRPGRSTWLGSILFGKKVEKILFAATKADHLHHKQHGRLTAIMEALLRDARDRADFAGARTQAMSIAALRATVEQQMPHDGDVLDVVQGTLLKTGKKAAFYPGDLPQDPGKLLAPARDAAESWLDGDYAVMNFAPADIELMPGEGPPHIRLDRAAEFLIGDRLT